MYNVHVQCIRINYNALFHWSILIVVNDEQLNNREEILFLV